MLTNFISLCLPCSSKYHALQDFSHTKNKVLICAVTGLVAVLTLPIFSLLAVFTFRCLVNKFSASKTLPPSTNKEKIEEISLKNLPIQEKKQETSQAQNLESFLSKENKSESCDSENKELPENSSAESVTENLDDEMLKFLKEKHASPLIHTIVENDHAKVKEFISKNQFINQADDDGNLPWHWAVWSNSLDILEILSPHVSDFTSFSFGGRTALSIAAENNNIEIVKFLVETIKINPNLPDENGVEAFYWAIFKGHYELIRYFLQRNENKQDFILFAASSAPVEVVKFLVEEGLSLSVNENGSTPQHFAALRGQLDTLKYLISKLSLNDFNTQNNQGQTPLSLAAKFGKTDVVKFLLEQGVDPFIGDTLGRLPLHYAAENHHSDIIGLLINLQDESGRTALSHQTDKEVAQFLLDLGADPDIPDRNDEIPLNWAIRNNSKDLVELFISISTNALKHYPLHQAASCSTPEILDLLLTHQVDPDLENQEKMLPMHYAVLAGKLDNFKLLWSKTTDKKAKTSSGDTVYDLAIKFKEIHLFLLSDENIVHFRKKKDLLSQIGSSLTILDPHFHH